MKSFIVLAVFVAAVAAVPLDYDKDAVIVRSENNNIGVDGYQFGYETSNGISQQEEAVLENAGTQDEGIAVRGQFSYTGTDGVQYIVTYIADRNGFQPSAPHIPHA